MTQMRLSDFDFHLPEDRIALRPARPRDSARLLQVKDGGLSDLGVLDLPNLLEPGDLLVFNDTRVIPAALTGVRPARAHGGGGDVEIEINLHKRDDEAVWRAFVRPAKRLKEGDTLHFKGGLTAEVREKREGGEVVLTFDRAGVELDKAIVEAGAPPLPPYIASKRAEDGKDRDDYQTIYARENGAVAAPTAGLHFTPRLMQALEQAGVALELVPPRYRSTYFAHVFSGGYSAGYYSYVWSEVLDADTVAWFKEDGGLSRKNGDRMRYGILSLGGSVDAQQMYEAFRGRPAAIEPLLERRGLTAE